MRTSGLGGFVHTKEVGNHFKPNIWPKLAIFKYSCLYLNTKISYFKPIAADQQHNFEFVTVYKNEKWGGQSEVECLNVELEDLGVFALPLVSHLILGNVFAFFSLLSAKMRVTTFIL